MSSITMYRERNGGLAGAARPELFLAVPENTEPETADFLSLQKIALAELRQACPELKKRKLIVWECRSPDPVVPVDVLLADRYCGVERYFAKPDSRDSCPPARAWRRAERKTVGDGADTVLCGCSRRGAQ